MEVGRMRELTLLAIVAILCLVALVKPRIGLLGYTWFALMQPDALAWAYGKYPLSLALAVTTLLGSLRFLPKIFALFCNPIVLLLLLLQVPITLSSVFALDPTLSYEPLQLFARIITMALLIPLLVDSERDLRVLLLVAALSIGLLGAKFGIYGLLHGGVSYTSGHVGFIGDNNDFALALAMSLPLCWCSRPLVRSKVAKTLLLGIVFATVSAIVMTHSRGGTLSMATAALVIALHEKRRVAVLCGIVLLALPAIYLVQDSYVPRMSTLENPDQERSARQRILYARGAIEMWRDYPLLGVGFGMLNQMAVWENYVPDATSERPQVIHNTYLQMLVDSGTPALLIYLALLFGTIAWLGASAARARKRTPGLEAYPIALQGSLLAFAVGCIFLSRVKFDLTYILLMTAAVWYSVQRSLPASTGTTAAPTDAGVAFAPRYLKPVPAPALVLAGSAEPGLNPRPSQ
jgi:probable O-glycosylation ligase (exosortase A-associated)